MGILAFIPTILIGTAIVVIVFPNFSLKGAWAVLTVCLGAGVGLGLTSATTFLWLAWIGRPAAAYLGVEVGGAILLTIMAVYRVYHSRPGSRDELTPDPETPDVPIKWLKRLAVILLLITAGSFGL